MQLSPDLGDDDIRHLGALCHHVPYAIRLVTAALSLDLVDVEGSLLGARLYNGSPYAIGPLSVCPVCL